jgi:hypothetical protein
MAVNLLSFDPCRGREFPVQIEEMMNVVQSHTCMRTHQSEAMIKFPGAILPEHVRDGVRVSVQNDIMNVDIETDEVGSGTGRPSEDGCVVPCSPDDLDLPPGPLTEAELEHAVRSDKDRAQSARFGRQLEARFWIGQGNGEVYSPALLLAECPDDGASTAAPTPCMLGE